VEDNNLTVVKHNQMIEARYSMSIMEQRILLFLISQLDFKNPNITQVQILTADLINFFDISNQGNSFASIRSACQSLVSCKIDLSNTDAVHLINVFGEIYHKKGSGIINANFYPKIMPYLAELKSHFTKYKLSAVAKFKSEYSIRIYELLKMHEYQASNNNFFKVIETPALRKILGITDKYKNFNNFETDVLKRATKEINEKSDINIEYKKIKKGKVITEIKFICISKQKIYNLNLDKEFLVNEEDEKLKNFLQSEFETLGIKSSVYKKWFEIYNLNLIKNNFDYTMKEYAVNKVKNITGYMNKALEHNYWNISELEKIAQKIKEEDLYNAKIQKELDEQKEHEIIKHKETDAINIFNELEENRKQLVLADLFLNYSHLKKYYETFGFSGHMPYFLLITLQRLNLIL
jgi:plasmid replication initiation protein